MEFLLVLIGLFLVAALIFVTIKVAPFGYEDEDGFHYLS